VRADLATRGLEDAELWAYGDSHDDEPLLQLADHGILVGRASLPSVLDTGG
jgi:phosphoserine phosphatase